MSEATRKLAWDDAVVLLLCGDVMLGRGVDQILPHPGKPMLHERMVHDARTYVDLAVQANGPIAVCAENDRVLFPGATEGFVELVR